MTDPTPITKSLGARGFPSLEAARKRLERRNRRLAISDALHALRPQPPGPIIQSLIDTASETDTPEIVVSRAKEWGYGT